MAKSVTTSICATSRASVKVGDSFYTVEWSEERAVPADIDEAQLADERAKLWEVCNTEVDLQIEDILRMTKK